jgi:outer membrane protein
MSSKLFLPVLALAGALTFAAPAGAQLKIGVINTQRAVLETGEMKKAAADLQAKYAPQQADIEKRTKELQDIQAKLENASKLNPQEAADLQADGQRKQRQLQRLTDDLQGEVDRERNDILNKGGQRMQAVVTKLAEEKGLDLVVDAANTLYFKQAMDITNDAIAAYNKQYPVAAKTP